MVAVIAAAFTLNLGGIRNRVFARSMLRIQSIAVLPLENLSGDTSQEYFVDGMTDALITDLAQVSSLRVISRTSAMHYKGSHPALPTIARELNVDAIVEGTVTRSGDRIRITAQLLDARSDRHLWAKAYDRDIREIMWLQQDVAGNIVQEIQARLTPEENLRSSRKRQVDPEAYDDYLRGSYFWFKFTDEGMTRAAEYFEKSVQKDPSYALGYAWLANAYDQLAVFVGPPKDFIPKAKKAAEKAVQLDDSLAEAHSSLAGKYIYDRDWTGADREFQRALQLNPGNALIHGGYARYLDFMGRFEEASRQHQITRELDPLMLIGFYIRGDHFLFLRQYDQAIAEFRAALDLDPNFFIAHKGLAKAYKSKGMEKESISEWEQEDMLAGEPDQAEATKIAYANGGYKGVLNAWLKHNQRQRAAGAYIDYSGDAWIQVQLGNKDLALQALEKAFAAGEDMGWINVEPVWDPIRSDSRFQDLLRRVGLPVRRPGALVTQASRPSHSRERNNWVMREMQPAPPLRIGRSIGALLAGLFAGVILSLGTDVVLHAIGAFPPWGQSMVGYDGPLLLATIYRTVYGVAGSYLAARLAPDRPMLHAMILGIVGLVVSLVGAIVTWNKGPAFGPHWYPLALVVLALPQSWAGGKLRVMQLRERADG